MARIPSPGVAEVSMNFTHDGQRVQNVFHVRATDGSWDVAGMQQLAGTFEGWWSGSMAGHCPTTLVLRSIIVSDLSAGGQAIEYTDGLPQPGLASAPALPNNVTVAVKWGTGLRGRSYRGRTYHLQLLEDQVSLNSLTVTALGNLLNTYNALRTTLDSFALDVEFCVLSETEDGAPRAAGVCTPITGCSIDPVIDSQRRRLPGRGA